MVILGADGKNLHFEARHLAVFRERIWLPKLYREIGKMMLVSRDAV